MSSWNRQITRKKVTLAIAGMTLIMWHLHSHLAMGFHSPPLSTVTLLMTQVLRLCRPLWKTQAMYEIVFFLFTFSAFEFHCNFIYRPLVPKLHSYTSAFPLVRCINVHLTNSNSVFLALYSSIACAAYTAGNLDFPSQQLKGFQKVTLEPGQVCIEVSLEFSTLRCRLSMFCNYLLP